MASDLTNRNIVSESLVDIIKRNRVCDRPMLIFGAPGVGKSQQVWQSICKAKTDPVKSQYLPISGRNWI